MAFSDTYLESYCAQIFGAPVNLQVHSITFVFVLCFCFLFFNLILFLFFILILIIQIIYRFQNMCPPSSALLLTSYKTKMKEKVFFSSSSLPPSPFSYATTTTITERIRLSNAEYYPTTLEGEIVDIISCSFLNFEAKALQIQRLVSVYE